MSWPRARSPGSGVHNQVPMYGPGNFRQTGDVDLVPRLDPRRVLLQVEVDVLREVLHGPHGSRGRVGDWRRRLCWTEVGRRFDENGFGRVGVC